MKFLRDLEENLMLVFMTIVTVFILIGWVFSFTASDKVGMTTEIAQYAYTWFTFLAFGLSVKKGLFVKIDVLTCHYPKSVQKTLDFAMNIVLFLCCVIFFILGCKGFAARMASGELSAKAGIPLAVVYLAPAVGFALAVIRYIQNALSRKNQKEA